MWGADSKIIHLKGTGKVSSQLTLNKHYKKEQGKAVGVSTEDIHALR